MKSRQNKKFLVGLFLFILFLLAVFVGSARNFAVNLGTAVFRPFLNFGSSIVNWADNNSYLLSGKETLSKENLVLKDKLAEMETKLLAYEILEKENKELKDIMSWSNKNEFFAARVISRPPKSPYDILIVDAGSERGIKNGMQVWAYDNILIGYVFEIFSDSSKIKLISFPGDETNAVLLSSNNQVIAAGKGDGNFEIKIPKSIEVNAGEKVVTFDVKSILIGIIDKIEINPSDPFQKLYFRFPFNLQELKYVAIKK
ncbi:MAG: rod shape-determining protein MreC [Candidatus Paceibacterota bacterium]